MYNQSRKSKSAKTSWQPVSKWYNELTRDKGHYFHEHIVIPKVIRLLSLHQNSTLLDLACGSGVLARALPKNVTFIGIDAAKDLIDAGKLQDKNQKHSYIVGDITKNLSSYGDLLSATTEIRDHKTEHFFSHATCILALQNVEDFQAVFTNAATLLEDNGTLVIVLNHPSFRIPRQTSWGMDPETKLQYRKINRYLSPLKIPVTIHPSQGERSPLTWSFHHPLSTYIEGLTKAGFVITGLEEWSSDKESEGKLKKMEDRARNEIPLFLTIVAKKEIH